MPCLACRPRCCAVRDVVSAALAARCRCGPACTVFFGGLLFVFLLFPCSWFPCSRGALASCVSARLGARCAALGSGSLGGRLPAARVLTVAWWRGRNGAVERPLSRRSRHCDFGPAPGDWRPWFSGRRGAFRAPARGPASTQPPPRRPSPWPASREAGATVSPRDSCWDGVTWRDVAAGGMRWEGPRSRGWSYKERASAFRVQTTGSQTPAGALHASRAPNPAFPATHLPASLVSGPHLPGPLSFHRPSACTLQATPSRRPGDVFHASTPPNPVFPAFHLPASLVSRPHLAFISPGISPSGCLRAGCWTLPPTPALQGAGRPRWPPGQRPGGRARATHNAVSTGTGDIAAKRARRDAKEGVPLQVLPACQRAFRERACPLRPLSRRGASLN